MEKIKLVNTSHPNNSPFETEVHSSVLSFVLKFQCQLDIESLISTYQECLSTIHSISGIRYRYPLLGINHLIGCETTEQCHIHIETNNEFLGDVTIYDIKTIEKSSLKSFELITTLLTHPLRAIIQEKGNLLVASNDETIGIANSVLVEQLVTREAKLAHRERAPMSLVLFDIDRFNIFAQNHDFITRDNILYQVMQVMRYCIRDTDLLFRYKNDTYCLILKGVTTENAFLISERIREAIDNNAFNIDGDKTSHFTISNGIAKLEREDSIESIFSRAMNAMQHAKKMGRNQSIIADGTFIK